MLSAEFPTRGAQVHPYSTHNKRILPTPNGSFGLNHTTSALNHTLLTHPPHSTTDNKRILPTQPPVTNGYSPLNHTTPRNAHSNAQPCLTDSAPYFLPTSTQAPLVVSHTFFLPSTSIGVRPLGLLKAGEPSTPSSPAAPSRPP